MGPPQWEYISAQTSCIIIQVSQDTTPPTGPMKEAHFNTITNQLVHIS